jgi:hypothetical protein
VPDEEEDNDDLDGAHEGAVREFLRSGAHAVRPGRHDATTPPRRHTYGAPDDPQRQADWPVRLPPQGGRIPTDADRRAVEAAIDALRAALVGHVRGENETRERTPVFDDGIVRAAKDVYRAVRGRPYVDALDERGRGLEEVVEGLAIRLRLRAQAEHHQRRADAMGRPERDLGIAMTGREIVDQLARLDLFPDGVGVPWPLRSEDVRARLARAVDGIKGRVGIGGAGGRGNAREPEAWARDLVLAAVDERAFRKRMRELGSERKARSGSRPEKRRK